MYMKERQTIYQAFGCLSDLLKEGQIELSVKGQRSVSRTSSAEKPPSEIDDFMTAMTGVMPIMTRKRRVPIDNRAESRFLPVSRQKDATMSSAMDDRVVDVLNLPEYMEGSAEDLNPLIIERLRGGEYSVQRIIDLHGLSVEEAEEIFRSFIIEAVRNRICCVKVIHGRGLKSKRGPVLKEKLKEWIVRAIHRRWVAAFCSAGMADGGPGATVLLLRTRADKRKLCIYG
jgi:DNA-nicking Smr family endonuclease